jgi:hypothetical protein
LYAEKAILFQKQSARESEAKVPDGVALTKVRKDLRESWVCSAKKRVT